MRKLLLLTVAVVGAITATAGPAVASQPIPWGEEITIIPGACVTHPCPFPVTVTVPDNPLG